MIKESKQTTTQKSPDPKGRVREHERNKEITECKSNNYVLIALNVNGLTSSIKVWLTGLSSLYVVYKRLASGEKYTD